jgi:putative acetyltransferase
MLRLLRVTSDHKDFQDLVRQLDQELWVRYGEAQGQYTSHNFVEQNRTVIVAYWDNRPSGCGCFKAFDSNTAELKRMFVNAQVRGKGIASAIVQELSAWALQSGFSRLILELGNNQPEALCLYKKSGFSVVDNYPPYVGMPLSICMAKTLA